MVVGQKILQVKDFDGRVMLLFMGASEILKDECVGGCQNNLLSELQID